MMLIKDSKKFSFSEINLLLKLAIPLVLTGVIESSVNFFSTNFLAQLGVRELAAGSVVSRIFVTLMVVLWGTLCSVSVLIAQKHGAKDNQGVTYVLRDGLILSVLLVIPASLVLWNIGPILLYTGQDPSIIGLAVTYMHALVWGFLPDFFGIALMQFLIGLGHTRTNLVFCLFWVPLNIFCNYGLIFGKFGFPVLGIAGIGWGTTLAYWISTLALFAYLLLHSDYRRYFSRILQLGSPRYLYELWQIGIPMGAMYCVELAFFLVLTLLIGRFGSAVLAGNQITMQYLMLVSMITFGVSQAVTVRMGHLLGAKAIHLAFRACYLGVSLALSVMCIIGLCYWLIPNILISFDLNVHLQRNAEVVRYATQFFAICALFQMVESIRIVLFGALRGLKDTRFTLLSSIICLWGIALPVGYMLATYYQWQGKGLWWGIVLGEACSAALLYWRFNCKMKQVAFRNKVQNDN